MQEIWKDVVGYEGLYQVSNLGRVKSILYFNHANKKAYPRNKILKPIKNKSGYLRIDLSKDNKVKRIRIHKLVADAFISNPNNYCEINHIDGNKENNLWTNLEWCTHSQNMKHAVKLGLVIPPKHHS